MLLSVVRRGGGTSSCVLVMLVTTVACVTEQIKNPRNRRKQLLRSVFDSCVIVNPTRRPHDPSATRHFNKNQRNSAADAYGAPSEENLPQQKELLHNAFDSYIIIRPTIRSHIPFSTLHINENHQHPIADTYGAFPSSSVSFTFLLSSCRT